MNRLTTYFFIGLLSVHDLSVEILRSIVCGDEPTDQAAELSPQDAALRADYLEKIALIVERNFGKCHGESNQEAGLRFDKLDPAMPSDNDVAAWSSVRDALNAHQMPPPDEERQPTEQQRQ